MDEKEIIENFKWVLKDFETNKVGLYKYDKFLENINTLIPDKAVCPISGGTRRTESEPKIKEWVKNQLKHEKNVKKYFNIKRKISISINDFPVSNTGSYTRTITTSKTQLFLINDSKDFMHCYENAFGKNDKIAKFIENKNIFLFEVDSLESGGRAFSGDPFTGQITAFSKIYCTDMKNNSDKKFVIYYPHQLYSQFFDRYGKIKNSKGLKIITKLVDLIITNNGITIDAKTWNIVD